MQKHLAELEALGAKVIAGSVDDEAQALEVGKDLSFPVAFGMTRPDADVLGGWWGEPRNILQPAEFILGANGKVVHSLYASGPVGRMAADEIVRLLTRMAEMEKAK